MKREVEEALTLLTEVVHGNAMLFNTRNVAAEKALATVRDAIGEERGHEFICDSHRQPIYFNNNDVGCPACFAAVELEDAKERIELILSQSRDDYKRGFYAGNAKHDRVLKWHYEERERLKAHCAEERPLPSEAQLAALISNMATGEYGWSLACAREVLRMMGER